MPILLYSCTAWTNINSTLSDKLETHHRFLWRTRFSQDSFVSNKALYKMTSARPLISHRHRPLCTLVHKIKLNLLPSHMGQYNLLHSGQHLSTRNSVVLPRATSDLMLTSPIFKAYSLWLNLGHNLKSISSLYKFTRMLP